MDIGPATCWSESKDLMRIAAAALIHNMDKPFKIEAAGLEENAYPLYDRSGRSDWKMDTPFRIGVATLITKCTQPLE